MMEHGSRRSLHISALTRKADDGGGATGLVHMALHLLERVLGKEPFAEAASSSPQARPRMFPMSRSVWPRPVQPGLERLQSGGSPVEAESLTDMASSQV